MGKKEKRVKKQKETKKKHIKNSENTNNSEKKTTGRKRKLDKKKIFKILLRIFLVLLVLGVMAVGVLLGVIFGLIKGQWSLSERDLAIGYENSVLVDSDGEVIASLSQTENRIIISKSEMSDWLREAFISIEDERFETHHGVDIKRTVGATLTFVTNKGSSSYGGSTITQQCIKNLTGEDDSHGINGVLRKVKEMARAAQLEQMWSKDQIIELYLNLIPLGGGSKNIYGVEMAARYYFNKSAKDLTVVESAYLAGITHSPNTYSPFGDNSYGTDENKTKKINKRVTNVLYKMNQLGRLNDEDYKKALEEIENGIHFEQGSTTNNSGLSYIAESAVSQIISELMQANNWSKAEAELHLYAGGYTIYTTQNSKIQAIVEKEYTSNKDWMTTAKDKNGNKVQIQSAMVIIDHKTGYVIGGAGALGEKTAWGTNRMTNAGRNPGSSIKPLAVIAPSLEEKKITAATVVDDTKTTWGGATPYTPHNDTPGNTGLMNIRNILRVSRNVPEVKMIERLTVAKSEEYLKSFGITTLDGREGLALALGAVSGGVSPLEMAAGYATIANFGVYIEPTFYTKIVDKDGNVYMEKEQESHRVISEQNAWIVQSLLTEPTATGLTGGSGATAPGAALAGYQTSGKTGTTDHSLFTWFCGFTPYYTATMYFGYDDPRLGTAPGSGTVARRWGKIMKQAHEGLPNAKFEMPEGIVTAAVCTKSGKLPTEACKEAGCVYTEYFVKGTVPGDACNAHKQVVICEETGLLAAENCPHPVTKVMIDRSVRDKNWETAGDAETVAPEGFCEHTTVSETPSNNEENVEENQNNQSPSEGNTGEGEGETQTTPGEGEGGNPTVPTNPPTDAGEHGENGSEVSGGDTPTESETSNEGA